MLAHTNSRQWRKLIRPSFNQRSTPTIGGSFQNTANIPQWGKLIRTSFSSRSTSFTAGSYQVPNPQWGTVSGSDQTADLLRLCWRMDQRRTHRTGPD